MDILLFQIAMLLSLGILIIPRTARYYFLLVLEILVITITSYWAFTAFGQADSVIKVLDFKFLGESPKLVIDSLSAFFILVVNFTSLTSLLYSKGYLEPFLQEKKNISISWHYFNFFWLFVSMLLVCMLRHGLLFLVVWEIMTVSSFMLVLFEFEKKSVLQAGMRYLIQMHIGVLFLIFGFVYIQIQTGLPIGFDSMEAYFQGINVVPLFLVFFIGFGIKAGFVPFHTWLPSAHPAAPSHVSGLMSGVMIKMGIYGILRTLTYINSDLVTIGVFITLFSAVSGLLGVIYAITQHDIKKLLAYHSIENIGIIGIGIGLGVIGLATNNHILAIMGFTGGILHVLNHSLFKSLLFYSAGSVYKKTHTKHIEALGGVIKKMPYTGIFFLLAALAICGLPPFNGFVSEFLIYAGAFGNLKTATFNFDFLFIGAILSLAFIGGLAIFCFVKVFGIVFLGSARTKRVMDAHEVSKNMLFPKFLIGLFILAIGLMPSVFVPFAAKAAQVIGGTGSIPETIYSGLSWSGIIGGIFIVLVLFVYGLKMFFQKNKIITKGETWGCGYTGADASRHQYTATSFADNHLEFLKPLFAEKKKFTQFQEDEIFPSQRDFDSHADDLFEAKLIGIPSRIIAKIFSGKTFLLQSAQLHHYVLYAIVFFIIIFILTIFKII